MLEPNCPTNVVLELVDMFLLRKAFGPRLLALPLIEVGTEDGFLYSWPLPGGGGTELSSFDSRVVFEARLNASGEGRGGKGGA